MPKRIWILTYHYRFGDEGSVVLSDTVPGRENWPVLFDNYEGHTVECEGQDGEGCENDDHRDDEWVTVEYGYASVDDMPNLDELMQMEGPRAV